MREAHNCCFCYVVMKYKCRFYFSCPHSVTRDIDHIINSTSNPIVAIFITPCSISCEVHPLILDKVGIEEALWISINTTHLSGPGILDTKSPFGCPLKFSSCLRINNDGLNSEEG